jgi:uncharacterized Zn-binding protein involved in type VI secretion
MPPAARITDPTTHGMPLAPGPGSVNVLIGGLPAWRAMIDQHACPAVSISGADGVGMVMLGSPTVLINFMMACRMGDIVMEIPGLALGPVNPIIMGEPTVMIGEVGMGSPTVVPPCPATRLVSPSDERQRHHRPLFRLRQPRRCWRSPGTSRTIRRSLY